jgi:hypothetical protein
MSTVRRGRRRPRVLLLATAVAVATLVGACGVTPEDSPRNIQEGRLPDSLKTTSTTP